MFTSNKISLHECAEKIALNIVRDCNFSYIGKVPTRLRDRLVPCSKKVHLQEALRSEGISGIITTPELSSVVPAAMGLVIHDMPQRVAYQIQEFIAGLPNFQWSNFETEIHPDARIESGAFVAPRNVRIGAGALVMAGAIIRERTIVGNKCTIGSGTVLGCEAFEVDTSGDSWGIVRQTGGVLLRDNVEILAKCTIVRATFGGFTEIGANSKFDCQVHLAHDSVVGERVRIAACAEISGRVSVGDNVFIGPNCSISNGVNIGDRAFVTIGSVVTKDVNIDEKVSGNFAIPHMKFLRFLKTIS